MRTLALILAVELLAVSIQAATSKEIETDRLRQVAGEISARRVAREHESGVKTATDAQLASARALIRQSEERRAREAAPGPDGGFSLTMTEADIATVAEMWQKVFGGIVTAAERVKSKRISFSVSDSSLDGFRKKAEAALRQYGIHFIPRPDALILDSEPDSYPRK